MAPDLEDIVDIGFDENFATNSDSSSIPFTISNEAEKFGNCGVIAVIVILLYCVVVVVVVVVVVCGGLKFCKLWLVPVCLSKQLESTNETGVCVYFYLGSDL